jgi:hypothetical protein
VHDQGVVHHPCGRRGEGVNRRIRMPGVLPRLKPSSWLTWRLPFIGDDAAHKVRMSGLQVGHQLI